MAKKGKKEKTRGRIIVDTIEWYLIDDDPPPLNMRVLVQDINRWIWFGTLEFETGERDSLTHWTFTSDEEPGTQPLYWAYVPEGVMNTSGCEPAGLPKDWGRMV